MSTPSISMTYPAITAESSSLQVAVKPSPATSKYRDIKIPRVRLADYLKLA
jgi:hypothetical protein